jgi:cysteine desulfurase family protein
VIYLDNAATTLPKPEPVARAVYDALLTQGNGGRGCHPAALAGLRTAYQVRRQLANLFHVPGGAEQVAFTSGATEALNTAIGGLFSPGDHVITTAWEHNSVLRPLYRLEEQGVELTILPADPAGRLRYEELEPLIRPNTRAVVCTHASNVTGNLLDLERVSALCRTHHLLLVVDGAQTAGVFPIDMEKLGIDVLCLAGHKGLMGPQGVGALCVRQGVSIRPLKVGGSGVHSFDRHHPAEMPTALEAGTLNGPGIAGLGAAIHWLEEQGVDQLRQREQELLKHFYDGVTRIPGVTVYGTWDTFDRAAVLSLNLKGWDSGEVSDELAQRFDIATRPGAHCAPLIHQALGTVERGTVRFSLSHQNTEAEVDRALEALDTLAGE